MSLLVDHREHILLQRLSAISSNLILGDICIQKDGKDLVIIERKTVADLSSSICDGRYKEQSHRLLESTMPPHRIVYLIEGSLDSIQSIPKQTMVSAMISLWFHKGFSVVQTTSIDDTIDYINLLFEKTMKEANESDYVSTIKIKKKQKHTPETVAILMLSQIPTISTVTAIALLAKYGSPFNLTKSLVDTPDCLSTFTYGEKKRKLAKNSIINLKEYLVR